MEDALIDARRITDASSLPLMVDIDTPAGAAPSTSRTIRSFIKAGVAAVHIEDQVRQKRCGHRPNKERVLKKRDGGPREGRRRCAHGRRPWKASTRRSIRAGAYVEAGTDMIFPEAIKTLDDYCRFKAAVRVPILANLTEFGSTPFFIVDELKSANVDIALYCCGAYRAMNAAALNFYETVKRDGTQKAAVETMQTRVDLYKYLGYHEYENKLDQLFTSRK